MATKPLLRQIETLQTNLRESAKVQEQVRASLDSVSQLLSLFNVPASQEVLVKIFAPAGGGWVDLQAAADWLPPCSCSGEREGSCPAISGASKIYFSFFLV